MNVRLQGLLNFGYNIKPLIKKLQEARKPETLTLAEMNQIVQFYLEALDVARIIESNEQMKEELWRE